MISEVIVGIFVALICVLTYFLVKEVINYIKELHEQVRFLTKAMMARDLNELTTNEAVNKDEPEQQMTDSNWLYTDSLDDEEFLDKIANENLPNDQD